MRSRRCSRILVFVPEDGGYDVFMRTTEAVSLQALQLSFGRLSRRTKPRRGNETIYKDFYEAWFCAPCAEFKTETEYVEKEGEECPFCPIHERPLDRVEEESYFFRLSDYEEALIEAIEANPDLIRPDSRKHEVLSFIKSGLQDLSISREKKNVSWGIPVPGDDDHVMYVWLDALSNYITAIGFGNDEKADIGFERYWPNSYHFIGKDILRFHTVYWFSFLMAAGIDLPKGVFAHGMWLDPEGKKMSSTLGNGIEPAILKQHFQVDAVRYFCLREMAFGKDGKFGYELLAERANADLAKGLGNLSSRTISMLNKYCDGKIPNGDISDENFLHAKRAGVHPDAQELVAVLELARDEFIREFDNFGFNSGLEALWRAIAHVDKMITSAAPWNLVKDEDQRETLNAVLYRSVETLRWLTVMLAPVMPESMASIWRQLGMEGAPSDIDPSTLQWAGTAVGQEVSKAEPVFPRIEISKIMEEIAKAAEEAEEEKIDYITIDDFLKVELRVGEVLEAEKVEKSEKLLKCKVDCGENEPRQILAGLAKDYAPEDLIGKKILVAYNLKPRKMMGMESQGMICAASLTREDKPIIATFLEDVPNGARLS